MKISLQAYVDPRYKFVMLDVRSSRHTLRAFLELAAEEVACSTIPGVTELQAIGIHVIAQTEGL